MNDTTVARSADGTTSCTYACCTGAATPIAAIASKSSATDGQNESAKPTPTAPTAPTIVDAKRTVLRLPQKRAMNSTTALPAIVARAMRADTTPATHTAS